MKKNIYIMVTLIIFFSILVIYKQNKKELIKISNKKLEESSFNIYNFYKEENKERYQNYKIKFPELSNKNIVLHSYYIIYLDILLFYK